MWNSLNKFLLAGLDRLTLFYNAKFRLNKHRKSHLTKQNSAEREQKLPGEESNGCQTSRDSESKERISQVARELPASGVNLCNLSVEWEQISKRKVSQRENSRSWRCIQEYKLRNHRGETVTSANTGRRQRCQPIIIHAEYADNSIVTRAGLPHKGASKSRKIAPIVNLFPYVALRWYFQTQMYLFLT